MLKKTVRKVERQTKKGQTHTTETTWGFSWNRRSRKRTNKDARKKQSWYQKEISEIGNTVIEACFNKWWHTAIFLTFSNHMIVYMQYLLVLIPWLPPVAVSAAAVLLSYVAAAVILFYFRRFAVFGFRKIKNLLQW